MGDYAQPVNVRLMAASMTGCIAKALQEEFTDDILEKTLLLAQDTNYEVRKKM